MSEENPEGNDKIDKVEWDKERQRADQEHANYEKAEEARARAIAENEAFAEQHASAQARITELEEKIAAQQEKQDEIELDPEYVDKNVIKEITRLKTQLKTATTTLSDLQEAKTRLEAKEQKAEADARLEKTINKVCLPLDKEYGAKHRNEARELAEKLVRSGEEEPPGDAFDAYVLMEKCYRKAAEKKKPKGTETDDGSGGAPPPPEARKEGTTEEVLADMKKNKSWKESSEDIYF